MWKVEIGQTLYWWGGGGTVLMFKIEGQAFFEAFILLRRSQFTTVSYDNW